MTDVFMTFPSQAVAETLLFGPEGDPMHLNTDVIGIIYHDDVPKDGWHVNLRLRDGELLSEGLQQYEIPRPLNPRRIYG